MRKFKSKFYLLICILTVLSGCSGLESIYKPYPPEGGPLPGTIILANPSQGESLVIASREALLREITDTSVLKIVEDSQLPKLDEYNKDFFKLYLDAVHNDSISNSSVNLSIDDFDEYHFLRKVAAVKTLRDGAVTWRRFLRKIPDEFREDINFFIEDYGELMFVTSIIVYKDAEITTKFKDGFSLDGNTKLPKYFLLSGGIQSGDSTHRILKYNNPVNVAYSGIRFSEKIEKPSESIPDTIAWRVTLQHEGGQNPDEGTQIAYCMKFKGEISEKPNAGLWKLEIYLDGNVSLSKYTFNSMRSKRLNAGASVRNEFDDLLKLNTEAILLIDGTKEIRLELIDKHLEVKVGDNDILKKMEIVLRNIDHTSQDQVRFHFHKEQLIPIKYYWIER